jgi:arylsulfatase A-like enzyme
MNRITRRTFLQQTAAAAALHALTPRGVFAQPRARPNLLYIMSDDLGYGDLGITGRTDYATPVLDAFAREGVRLTQAYCAAPVCTPTRVGLNTGRYPARNRAGLFEPITSQEGGLLPTPKTLGRMIKDAGYDTALIGKWHLGASSEFHPLRHGYDEFYGFLAGASDYVSHPGLMDGEKAVKVDGYLTDLLTERAVQYVTRPHARPFFLNLEYNAPHWPWQGPGDPPHPDSVPMTAGGSPAVYARMMQRLDEGIGTILTALRQAGHERDTLVIFTNDNGGERYSQMGPFTHGKMSLYEGGLRTPAFARWPGVIAPNTTTDQVAITMDWTATLLARAGARPDANVPLDGIDLLPALTGGPAVSRDLYWRIFQRARQKALRSADWKYLATDDGEFLFDVKQDPGEKSDQKATHDDIFASLKGKYADWERGMLTPIPLNVQTR